MAGLFWWMFRKEAPTRRRICERIVIPVFIVLILTAGFMAFYNLRVTGNPLLLPYMVHEETYAVAPPFLWQHVRPEPFYRHKAIRDVHLKWELSSYESQRSIGGFLSEGLWKATLLVAGCFWLWVPALPRLVIPWPKITDRWTRFALLILVLFIIGLLAETWLQLHYAGPIVSMVFAFALQNMRYLHSRRRERTWRYVLLATLTLSVVSLVGQSTNLSRDNAAWSSQRARILADLKQRGERHLVVVRYSSEHNYEHEWVSNAADIDGADVVWAREMDAAEDAKLLKYFNDRRAWLLEADSETPKLIPYPVEQGP